MGEPIAQPDVTVQQIFVKQNPTLVAPDLPSVLIGISRQIEFKEDAGEYSGSPLSIPYPSLKIGAVVEQETVDVFFSNSDGVFQITDFTTDADSINIDGGIELDIRKIENSQTGVSSGIFFDDAEVNFFTAFADLANSSSIVISSPTNNQKVFVVEEVITKNKVRIREKEEGQVRSSETFDTAFASTSLTYVDAGDTTTEPLAVQKSGFVVGTINATVGLTTTYSATATLIDGESPINNETDIIVGDNIFFEALGATTLKKITAINPTTGAVTLNETLGATVTAGTGYKIFHPVKTLDQTLNHAGDFIIATRVSDSKKFTGEISAIVGLNTVTLRKSLQDNSALVNTTGWTTSDTFEVHRGALQNTDSNVYDAFITDASFKADTLVSYNAVRNDLNDDTESITGIDDIDAILGPGVPENPLSLAARIHTSVSDDLFFVIGVGADTLAAHQGALEVLESKEVYSLVPLTQNLSIIPAYSSHVTNLSKPEEKRERVAIVNRDIFISDLVTIGTTNLILGGTDSADRLVLGLINQDDFILTQALTTKTIAFNGVGFAAQAGDRFVRFDGSDLATTISTGLITGISTDLASLSIDNAISWSAGDSFQIISLGDTLSIADGQKDFTSVSIGDVVNLLDANSAIDQTSAVTSKLEITDGSGRSLLLLDDDLGSDLKNQTFSITTQPLSKLEQAQFMRDYAASLLNRRLIHVFAPEANQTFTTIEDPTVEATEKLPGYFLAAGVAAQKSENTPAQPLTNVPLPIATQLFFTNDHFKPSFLDIIAGGGNYILVQDTPESLPFSRHQLTTDATSIQTQEFSIVSAVDWFAKFMRDQLRPFIGRFNITANYLAQIKAVANSVINKTVKDLKYLRKVDILKLEQNTESPDTVILDLDITVLFPANRIQIRLFI